MFQIDVRIRQCFPHQNLESADSPQSFTSPNFCVIQLQYAHYSLDDTELLRHCITLLMP